MLPYYRRFFIISITLALLTAALAVWQPGTRASVASTTPEGAAVPVTASIRVTFDEPVDRAVTGRSLRIVPAVPGEISWQQDALVFTPSRPLTPTLDYRVTLTPASWRAVGAATVSWNFRTRARRLFYRDQTGVWVLGEKLPRRLLTASGVTSFALSPDGERMVYSVRRDDDHEALLLLNLRDSTSKTISDSPDERASQPAWSPANDFISYTRSTRSGNTWQPDAIWLAQTDGTPLGPLALGLTGELPQFAGSAQRLAFLNGTTLTVVSLSGAGGAVATDVRGPFAWSPDSSKIAYVNTNGQVLIADVSSRSVQPIASADNTNALAWLPDSKLAIANGGAIVIIGSDGAASAPATLCATPISALTITADGTTLAAVCGNEQQIITATLSNLKPVVVGTGATVTWGP